MSAASRRSSHEHEEAACVPEANRLHVVTLLRAWRYRHATTNNLWYAWVGGKARCSHYCRVQPVLQCANDAYPHGGLESMIYQCRFCLRHIHLVPGHATYCQCGKTLERHLGLRTMNAYKSVSDGIQAVASRF